MKEILTLYTSIQPPLLKRTLFKGFKLAVLGLLAIVISGIWLSRELLNEWGFLIFTIGIVLIAMGLLPYRRLSLLASKPNKILVTGLDRLEFYASNRPPLAIPLSAIERMEFIEDKTIYGIGILLNQAFKDQLREYPNGLNLNILQKGYAHQLGMDLFFPYFSKRSFDELHEWITVHSE